MARLPSILRHASRDSGVCTYPARAAKWLGWGRANFWALSGGGPTLLFRCADLWGVALFTFNPCWAGPYTGLSLPILIGLQTAACERPTLLRIECHVSLPPLLGALDSGHSAPTFSLGEPSPPPDTLPAGDASGFRPFGLEPSPGVVSDGSEWGAAKGGEGADVRGCCSGLHVGGRFERAAASLDHSGLGLGGASAPSL